MKREGKCFSGKKARMGKGPVTGENIQIRCGSRKVGWLQGRSEEEIRLKVEFEF